ncbi:MAG: undecaprenyl-diphosphate phosphatase [candidate division WOR-3 bacterium]
MKELIVGIIQGITEFLPVSSSGHLVLTQSILKISKPGIEFEIFLHFSTLLAVLIFFFKEIKNLAQKENPKNLPLTLIIIGSIPAGVIGVLFKDKIELYFENTTYLPYFYLITTAMLFSTSLRKKAVRENITILDALIIGTAQAIAILPGVSRSGATISTALLLGILPEKAFSFSFLLSIPAIFGAMILDLKDANFSTLLSYAPAGTIAFLFGIASLYILKKTLKMNKLHYFGFYTLIVAILTFGLKL